jgi:hypothetical protein
MTIYEQVFCLVVKIHCYRAKKYVKDSENGGWLRPSLIADLMGMEDG